MNTLPSISEHIDQNVINKVIEDNFAALAPSFYTLASNWFVRAYDHYKDIDKFVIIIYLINQDLIYFRQNGVKIDYDTFYKDKSIEINKINISDISKDLGVPKESIRRKVLELEKLGVIKRTGKKIFIVRNTLYSARATNTLTEIATILHEFNKILKKEKLTTEIYSVDEIILATSATVEGQTTAFYIQDSLRNIDVKISKLAQGLPIGGEIENLDDGTLISAFKNRKNLGQ